MSEAMNDQRPVPGLQGLSIVVLGRFNPAILHPLWFSTYGLLPLAETTNANVRIVNSDVAMFSTEWFSLQALDDRFCIETTDPTKYLSLRDLAVGVFRVLEHTPVRAFGINTTQQFEMESAEGWHAFGDHYAPKTTWDELLIRPGLRTLIIEGRRKDCAADQMQIRIQPAGKLVHGVFIHINEHYSIKSASDYSGARSLEFVQTLQSAWDDFLNYSRVVSQHLLREFRVSMR